MNNDEIIANEMNNNEEILPDETPQEAAGLTGQADCEAQPDTESGQLTDGPADDGAEETPLREYEQSDSWPYCNSILERLFRSIREALEIEELDIEVGNLEELEIDALEIDGLDDYDDGDAPELPRNEDFDPIERIFENRQERKESEDRLFGEGSVSRMFSRIVREVGGGAEEKDDFDASPRKMAPTIISLAVCLLVMLGVTCYILCAHDLRAVMSVKQLEVAADAYRMTYTGDYGLEELLEQGGVMEEKSLARFVGDQLSFDMLGDPHIAESRVESTSCAFSAENSIALYGILTGRTFHSSEEMMILTLVTRPKDGYASVSTVDLTALGYTSYNRPGLFNRRSILAAPYLPMDGMNERGLCAALLPLCDMPPVYYNTSLPDLTATTAVRLVLDRARDVAEALELLSGYDVHPSFGCVCQLALSDHSGRCVVVEWAEGQMTVTDQPYAANSSLSDPLCEDSPALLDSAERFSTMQSKHEQYSGAMTQPQVFNAMEAVAAEGNGWITVFDTGSCLATYVFGSDRDTRFSVSID